MISSTLRVCICKNALAHRRASNVPILAGGTKGRLATHLLDNLRLLLKKVGRESWGVCEPTCPLYTCDVLLHSASLIPKGKLQEGCRGQNTPWPTPRVDRRRTTGEPPIDTLNLPMPFWLGWGLLQDWPWRTGPEQFVRSPGSCTTTAPSQTNRHCRFSFHCRE